MDNLTIRWVQSHQDDSTLHQGNAFADHLAKQGAMAKNLATLVHPEDIPLQTLATLKSKVYSHLKAEWTRRWQNPLPKQAKCRQTKHWFPRPNPRTSYQLLSGRSRYEYSILVHAITGHNHLSYHENKHNTEHSPMCTVCNIPGTSMTTQHLFTDCEALANKRLKIFGTHTINIPYDISIQNAVQFLRECSEDVGWLPVDEFKDN